MSEQDVLTKSLQELEDQLSALGTVQQNLASAREQCDGAREQYELAAQRLTEGEQALTSWTTAQKVMIGELAQSTAQSIDAMHSALTHLESAGSSVLALAKAIERVDFPQRLDKIDLAVSSQLAVMASFQTDAGKRHADLLAEQENRHASLLAALEQHNAGLLAESQKKQDELLKEIEKKYGRLLADAEEKSKSAWLDNRLMFFAIFILMWIIVIFVWLQTA